MKQLYIILSLFFTFISQAQSVSEKIIVAADITSIQIDGNSMFKIEVESKPVDEISIQSRVEGENNAGYILVTEIKNETLYIAVKKQPSFKNANDKLSAHKVISIELFLVFPENKELSIVSDIASVDLKGIYKKAVVSLFNGNCNFHSFRGNAKINTIDGNVYLETNYAKITAHSKNGKIEKEKIVAGEHVISTKTINGNIRLTKSQ
ncbi:hypothetical protein [Oceanihabitans sediminis]|uniref:Adhesin domain-containing protein n=1 Tax=Oceanihabitans sediminis TaxID=1812012 RepID=A0A368P7Q7_9FLAO|nr:hypothetical protein [Oceanihabitans sediminis]MDX1278041.1 hypothetical protein [Oceanihabitans sediminis]MDX1773150.1 hypothetical protein [Oceanihabitans sediminis]RBP34842.1 hypothetical protein DFR65_101742 [Oceanihabitans sediminis]RCU58486.1 hypothetical protein DU428_03675 [Oceanihabitans sediminis]